MAFFGIIQYFVVKYFLSEELSTLLTTLLMGLLPLVTIYVILPIICYATNPQLVSYVKGIIFMK